MAERFEMRLAGSGGQGLILASVILAEAAVTAGKYVAQTQSYGPEARGGLCRAEVVLSDERISFFKVRRPDFLLALTQASLDLYGKDLPERCTVMTDESLTVPRYLEQRRVIRIPILRAAAEQVGKSLAANIVSVAAINKLFGLVPDDVLRQAVLLHLPKGTEQLNDLALEVGAKLLPDQ